MKKLSRERRRAVAVASAATAISSSSLLLFKDVPHTAFYDAIHGLIVGVPLGAALALFYKLKRRSQCGTVDNP